MGLPAAAPGAVALTLALGTVGGGAFGNGPTSGRAVLPRVGEELSGACWFRSRVGALLLVVDASAAGGRPRTSS